MKGGWWCFIIYLNFFCILHWCLSLFLSRFIPQSAYIEIQFTIGILSLLVISVARARAISFVKSSISWYRLTVTLSVRVCWCMNVCLCVCVFICMCHSLFVRYAFNDFILFFLLLLLWFTFIYLSLVCLPLFYFHFSLFFALANGHIIW